jgi:antitoxin (DNA-binding transcriptional repressor) of toxin-antitoxin stability system
MIQGMSSTRRVTVTEAARNFADIVNRAFYRHETTILVRNGVAVAYIAPAAPTGLSAREALARWRLMPHLDSRDASEMKRDIAAGRRKLRRVRSPWK